MWKYIIALLIPIAAFSGGYYYGSGNVITKIVETKGETVTVVKDRIITRTVVRHPDGTVTETTKEEEINHNTTSTTTVRDNSTIPKARADYRLGAQYWVGSISDAGGWNNDHLGITGSRRVWGPVWVDASARPFGPKKEISLGLAMEF